MPDAFGGFTAPEVLATDFNERHAHLLAEAADTTMLMQGKVSDRLRYRAGEERVNEMWQEALVRLPLEGTVSDESMRIALAEAVSAECVEVVALGCVVPGRSELVWCEFTNESGEPSGSFDVSDEQMRVGIASVLEDFPNASAHVLWHSHYRSEDPSRVDISTFPEWLVGVGVIYHAPTATSRAYDETGSLFSTSQPMPHTP